MKVTKFKTHVLVKRAASQFSNFSSTPRARANPNDARAGFSDGGPSEQLWVPGEYDYY